MAATIDRATAPVADQGAHESFVQRVSDYPVVKDTFTTFYNVVQSNSISSRVYSTAESVATQILARLEPLQTRLPIERVNGVGCAGLDFVEKRLPLKTETEVIIQRVRKPADDAVGIAKAYSDGIQQRFSPVTGPLHAGVTKAQERLHQLQERLASVIAAIPRDPSQASAAVTSIFRELESLSTHITTTVKELPAHAQAASKPLVEGLSEGLTHIREELGKPDVPITTKANNILLYTQEKVGPVLAAIKSNLVGAKKTVAEKTADVPTPTANGKQ